MNEIKPISNFRNNLYQVAIILLLAYAGFSTAMKDLDRLQEVVGNVQSATAHGLGGLAKVYSTTKSLAHGPELAQAPELIAPPEAAPRANFIAAGGSVALTGFDGGSVANVSRHKIFATEKVHNALACPLRKRELPKAASENLNWNVVAQNVVAQGPERMELLRPEFAFKDNPEIATLIRRSPRVRAIIKKLPVKADKAKWSNVGEFKSLGDAIGFGLKAAQVEDAETQRHVETADDATRYLFEFKRGVSDGEKDESSHK